MKRRTTMGGSVASFVALGVIIVLVFLGAFYYLKTHSDQAREQQQIASESKQNNTQKVDLSDQSSDQSSTSNNNTPEKNKSDSTTVTMPQTGPDLDGLLIALLAGMFTTAIVYALSFSR